MYSGLALYWRYIAFFNWEYWREVISSSENSILILIYASLFSLVLAALCAGFSGALRIGVIISSLAMPPITVPA